MLLVPRQLRRAGMTGDVPYYGGRMSPSQAYAVTHPGPPPKSVRTAVDVVGRTVPAPPAPPALRRPAPLPSQDDTLASLRHLLDSGVISAQEYQQLRARVSA
jgi:hypothetical protein